MHGSHIERFSPVIKRWSVIAALLVIQAVIRVVFNWNLNMVADILIGIFVAWISVWVVAGREGIKRRLAENKRKAQGVHAMRLGRIRDKHWWLAVARATFGYIAGNTSTIMMLLCCVAVSIYVFSDPPRPQEMFVAQVLEIVTKFGPLVVVIVFGIPMMAGRVGNGNAPTLALSSALARMLAVYGFVCWTLGMLGDKMYRYAVQHPHDAAVISVAALIMFFMVRVGVPSFGHGTSVSHAASAFVDDDIEGQPVILVTKRDREYVAAHEAAHALVYAALGGLPPGLNVTVLDHVGENGLLGFVSGVRQEHRLLQQQFVEWQLLVFLAGNYGEGVAFGEVTIGSGDDQRRWTRMAVDYLCNHVRGVFYNDPCTDAERKHNAEKLDLLRAEQHELLRVFFARNSMVFTDLRKSLEEKKTILGGELVPYLQRVVLPEGFPLPVGPFGAFSAEPLDLVESPLTRWR